MRRDLWFDFHGKRVIAWVGWPDLTPGAQSGPEHWLVAMEGKVGPQIGPDFRPSEDQGNAAGRIRQWIEGQIATR
jgi:hypothetical protein